jgi:hypothetical protein
MFVDHPKLADNLIIRKTGSQGLSCSWKLFIYEGAAKGVRSLTRPIFEGGLNCLGKQ